MVSTRNIIELKDVSVVRGRVPVLNEVNLNVADGETVALMGANGAGKSTLLKILAGALRPPKGEIRLLGGSLSSSAARRQIGFLGHESGLYGELTVLENLMFAARMHDLSSRTGRADQLLSQAGLKDMAHRPVARLSQGIRRRVAILRAVVHNPRLILLDEPFTGLDVDGYRWLENCFGEWRAAQRAVCFACHDLTQGNRLADRVVQIDSGRIAAAEPSASFHTSLRPCA